MCFFLSHNNQNRQRPTTIEDLSLIKEHLDDVEPKAYYDSKERLKADFDLMINNCKTYNAEDTDYWAAADALQKSIAEIFSR